MKFLLYLTFIGIFIKSCDRNSSEKILIPGTHVKLLPWGNYSLLKDASGLKWGQDIVLDIMDFPGNDFHTTEISFTKEGLEKRGLKVFEFTDTIMNGYHTKLAYLDGSNLMREFELTFGDSSFSCLAVAMCPDNMEQSKKDSMKRTLLSIEYDKKIKVDPFATARFKVNNNTSDLKFYKLTGNGYMYSINGKSNPFDFPDEPILSLSSMPYSKGLQLSDYHLMRTKGFVGTDILNYSIESEKDTLLDTFNCLETIGYADINNKKVLIFIAVLKCQDNVLCVEAISHGDFKNDLKKFNEFTDAITIK